MSARYTYGDTDVAAERLGLVAEIFEPTTVAFLRRAELEHPRLALDLGCGPGHTTRLVADTLRPARTVGVDRSGAFLDLARRSATPEIEFMNHDVTITPFPLAPADLIHSRLLLAHLSDPAELASRWSSQLTIGGLLLLDELEDVTSEEPSVEAYLREVAEPVVARQGASLIAGPTLHGMPDPPTSARLADDVVVFSPPAAASARIFATNLAVLTARGEAEPRPDLAAALDEIAAGRQAAPVVWRLRQMVFRRLRS